MVQCDSSKSTQSQESAQVILCLFLYSRIMVRHDSPPHSEELEN